MKVLVAICAFLLTSIASAGDLYAIVDNYGKRPLNAYLDVSVDDPEPLRSAEVIFEVYDPDGTRIAENFVFTQRGFASTFSSGNLFALSDGRPILVRALTPSPAFEFGAALHTEVRGAHTVVGVLQKFKADGTLYGAGRLFSMPLGSFQRASVLIANVSGSDVGIESFSAAKNANGSGTQLNARLQPHRIHKVNLTQTDAFTNYIINSTGLVIVQVVIDDGKTIQSYMVPPSS